MKIKKYILLVLCISLIALFGGASISVYAADETPAETVGEVIAPDDETSADETPAENTDELTDKITERIKAYLSESDYFTKNILPLVISAGSTLLLGAGMLLPYLKKNAKYKQLLGLYKGLQAKTDELTKAIQDSDPKKLQEVLSEALGPQFTKMIESLKLDKKTYSEFKAQLDTLSAQLTALINGATNAWRGSESAVACLSASPTQSAVEKQAAEAKALEDYIRETKGDEADQIISELKAQA